MYTKDDVGPSYVDGRRIDLSEAEKQRIANEWNAAEVPVPIDGIPLSLEERLELLEAENPVPAGKVRAKKQAKRDRGEA